MWVTDAQYQEHAVFNELDDYIAFYRDLADSVFLWVSQGTRAFANIDSYVFSSMQGTLASIHLILRDGRINDSYALLRKYYDSAMINIYSNLYLENHFALDNLVVQQIDNWRAGKTRLPEYRTMSRYVRSSSKVAPVTDLLFADDHYRRLRDRCNDHTHYNFYSHMLLNDKEIHQPARGKAIDEFSKDVRDVFVLHIAYLFWAKEHYMMSSDYTDSLECGMTPDPDSQYWVAPFVQVAFDQILAKCRPDVAAVIKRNTKMRLG
jgi:hypothetical protein